jgi:hypothetical protein
VVSVGGGGGGGSGCWSPFFFFLSDDVLVVDVVEVVSVADVDVVSVVLVALVSVCSGGGEDACRCLGMGGVLLPTVSVTTGAVAGTSRVDVRCGAAAGGAPLPDGGVDGSEPATVGAVVALPSGFGLFGSVKFVVVSTLVSVTNGGLVSPGPLMVEVTPLADPSGTTSYCC